MNDEFYNRGLEKANTKDYTGAIEDFTRALELDPYFVEAYFQRGLAYYDSGEVLKAVFDYTEALKLNPQSVEAYYCRALARVGLKNLPGALEDVDQAIRRNSNYAAAYNLKGIVRRKQGFIQDAIANFKKAAELYLEQKDKENCQECLDKIKQLQPTEKTVVLEQWTYKPARIISEKEYFTQLLEKAERGNVQQAMEDLDWALKVDPQDAQAYCCRGVVHCKLGNYQKAISDFNQALLLNFQDAIVYRNRGKARFQLGDYRGALADFNCALQTQPEDVLLYIARGNVFRAMGNYHAAIKDYTQALQINPDEAQIYYNRGMAYSCIEEIQRAVEDYQYAASIFCEKEDWENYQQVLDSLKKIQFTNSDSSKATYNVLRQRLLRLVGGHWEIAQRLITQAKSYYPGMPEEWYIEKVIHDLERDREN
ncbi:tetratricopeptide repeat protein [Aetokthonos hydrillicola Thurmond2011]|jgi:tetratricopeptide (TPR) repeat protein|uniref:Tetratricopeptide repeat protein n=1 Tax=Aetokthonos hydrillicola Thurmond2011 TaxID=2712845 RepID=A0AAP5I9Y1_9CYAN|nr:tetratricopeptide repeat protein [Aetokthonos hydrillicola]MBO3460221.1 tetratricopeptide repeat protein [Aetokthonos hydrillicola CCALA 1050]MBW4586954.1 tetratricopeptide repeat protein [Aetokthonos hydrillicola CCALA 1050]MDR9897571.1 tetratricopeptide repeat protein [Aetokthonos hydrillicola Thurmond2011]